MDLSNRTLDDVERLYLDGQISYTEMVDYIRHWNSFPGRFTQAVFSDGRIRNFPPESAVFYRHLSDEFGVRG